MQTPNTLPKGNANSPAAASAAGQSTANANGQPPATGPLPISALEEALVRLESQPAGSGAPTQPQAEPGAPDPGQATPPDPGAGAPPADPQTPPEDPNQPPAEGDLSPTTENEPAAGGEPTGEPTEPEAGAGGDDPIGVRKRIGSLQAEIRKLREELDAQKAKPGETQPQTPPGQPAGPMPLENVTDPAELATRKNRAQEGLEEVQHLLELLPISPEEVESYLRERNVVVKDEHGEEDFSPQRVAHVLLNAKRVFAQTLRDVPRREAYLQQFAQAHAEVVKRVPWVADKTDPRYAMMQQMLQDEPAIKARPNFEYWLACAVTGHQLLSKTPAPGARPAAAARKPAPPQSGSGGAAPPRPSTDQAKVKTAGARVVSERSKPALADFLDATGFAKPG